MVNLKVRKDSPTPPCPRRCTSTSPQVNLQRRSQMKTKTTLTSQSSLLNQRLRPNGPTGRRGSQRQIARILPMPPFTTLHLHDYLQRFLFTSSSNFPVLATSCHVCAYRGTGVHARSSCFGTNHISTNPPASSKWSQF